jgi:hypothetical protein
MKRTLSTLAILWLACSAALAGSFDIPDEVNARLARSKTQAAAEAGAQARDAVAVGGLTAIGGAPGGGCNIAIGNVIADQKPGAISTSAKRETTVIVTGDVIQVGNNCR